MFSLTFQIFENCFVKNTQLTSTDTEFCGFPQISFFSKNFQKILIFLADKIWT